MKQLVDFRPDRLRNERGAAAIEYASILAILIVTFLIAGSALVEASGLRRDQSVETVRTMAPCGGRLSGEECL